MAGARSFSYTIITTPTTPPTYQWVCDFCGAKGHSFETLERARTFGERHVSGRPV